MTCIGQHGLGTGDIVSICGQLYRVEVLSQSEFNALLVNADQEDTLAKWDSASQEQVKLVRRNYERETHNYVRTLYIFCLKRLCRKKAVFCSG